MTAYTRVQTTRFQPFENQIRVAGAGSAEIRARVRCGSLKSSLSGGPPTALGPNGSRAKWGIGQLADAGSGPCARRTRTNDGARSPNNSDHPWTKFSVERTVASRCPHLTIWHVLPFRFQRARRFMRECF
jgi:hypothetical protein